MNNAIPPFAPPQPAGSLLLPPVTSGTATLQQYNPEVSAVLIQPGASVGVTLTDNARNTNSPRVDAVYGTLIPGLSISADTPRFQGLFTGKAQALFYTPTSD